MSRGIARLRAAAPAVILACAAAACATRSAPPIEPGYERGGIPDLGGARVMVFPVQLGGDSYPELDAEIEYALGQEGEEPTWLFPRELEAAASRNPGTELAVRGLPVRSLLTTELERLSDPLFGHVYRLGALTGASHALFPLEARETLTDDGAAVFLELTSALVDVRSGYVLWFGVVRGSDGPEGSLVLPASLAEELARQVTP